MNDTGSNAMTEVALGLSMAFFSILILALMSMGAQENETVESTDIEAFAHISMQAKIAKPMDGVSSKLESKTSASNKPILYFYLDGNFFDRDGLKVSNNHVASEGELVIAVAEDLPIQEALLVQNELSGTSLKMTTMSNEWLDYLAGKI